MNQALYFLLLLFFQICAAADSHGQDSLPATDTIEKQKRFELKSYLKNLEYISFSNGFSHSMSNNLVHNRINMKWKPAENFTAALEVRNRLFWGEEVKNNPVFKELLENPTEAISLSKVWSGSRSVIFHTNVERLWAEYHTDQLNFRIGRQRINWGINTLWNPNDLFNTYNFLDFDYEERPGSDAIKGQYNFGFNTYLEVAAASTGQEEQIAALKLFTNKWSYDFQLVGAWYLQQWAAGSGWAGSIRDAGFKGELLYFFKSPKAKDQLNVSLEFDYMFEKEWYFNLAGLYNKRGINQQIPSLESLDFRLSPKNLIPMKWTLAITANKPINPLLQAGFTGTYSPGPDLIILYPSLRYNLATNLDVDLVWQSFLAGIEGELNDLNHTAFLRFKWSF